MNPKGLVCLALLFTSNLLLSCINCSCGTIPDYEIDYYDFELKALDTSGFEEQVVAEPIYKNSFGLELTLLYNMTQLSQIFSPSSMGFSSAYACSCVEGMYYIMDSIKDISIKMIDLGSGVEQEVFENFSIYRNGMIVSLEESFENREYWDNRIQLQLSNFEAIPERARFIVTLILESGVMFTKESEEIEFVN